MLVAITATTKVIEGMSRVRLNEAYVSALAGAGLVPLIVPPLETVDPDAILDAVQGLVLSGGEDVAPKEYGAAASPMTYAPHLLRDRTELTLARRARERRMPTLAICRGIQLINVALGGTLVQDIPSEVKTPLEHGLSERRTERVHDIEVTEGSKLAQALGGTRIAVNSSHHQAIATPAKGLTITARSSDGVIEGAEWTADDWWMLGVQWHPEELVGDAQPWDRNLFAAFAASLSS
ncbi:MAG TPA: gamma-glutamyl-gamma-aminobutyrate hydrolase family protein [Gemmatimonadaceae bacterium]|nr:gamma-glutamyl-gamma-aminobutyrate hydrolase family protein [Gemmatimonadaceae bacterium]